MTRGIVRASLVAVAVTFVIVAMSNPSFAQRGGGGGGMRGGEFGGFQLTRLETLTASFELTKDQKKTVKTLLDDAHKNAASNREGLLSAHAAIGAAVAANKNQTEVDAAVKEYGQQAAAMAALEMKTLAQLVQQLEAPQRTNGQAIRTAFFLMRGIFLDAKKWDAVPDLRSY
jgi:Heavy-metal resistance